MTRTTLLVAFLGLAIASSGCANLGFTGHDPNQQVRVLNQSPRAVMVTIGSIFQNQGRTTAARPCGEVTVALSKTDFEEDGRLLVFLAIDDTGAFDTALANFEGDPFDMPGSYSASPIWSDGTLAGQLPVTLTVASDQSVTVGPARAPAASVVGCTPDPTAS